MNFLADVYKARQLTALILLEAKERGLTLGEAVESARMYLVLRGYPAPDDPLAFATAGRSSMHDYNLRDRL